MFVALLTVFALAAPPDFTVVAGERSGPIRETTSRTDLDRLFGRNSMKEASVYLGEGRCAEGARVYGGTANEIKVAWQDAARTPVALVRSQAHLPERVSALSGDIELRSNLPKVAALRSRIRVRVIEQSWGNGEIPGSDCETNPAVRTQ